MTPLSEQEQLQELRLGIGDRSQHDDDDDDDDDYESMQVEEDEPVYVGMATWLDVEAGAPLIVEQAHTDSVDTPNPMHVMNRDGPPPHDDDEHEHSQQPQRQRQALDLTWSNIHLTVAQRRRRLCNATTDSSKEHKHILTNVSGGMPRHQVTAIMGPSGAGKTSLMHVLTGRLRTTNVQGQVWLRGREVQLQSTLACAQYRQSVAFVAQDDALPGTSTPRECIRFSAKLRLPRSTADDDIQDLVTNMLAELGLEACADTVLGSPLNATGGISGGERKRTSVATEMVTRPHLVCLDEPTSGLDSFAALQLCRVLHAITRRHPKTNNNNNNNNNGCSVMLTIHQPSSELLTTLDHLILLHAGRVMYQGPVSQIPTYFGSRGFVVPPNYNPADWIIQVARTNPVQKLEQRGFFASSSSSTQPHQPQHEPQENEPNAPAFFPSRNTKSPPSNNDSPPVGFCVQTRLLWNREVTNLLRNQQALAARMLLTVLISGAIGAIFFQVATLNFENYMHVQSTFAALLMTMVAILISTSIPSLISIPEERPVFLREYSTSHYSVAAYVCSRLLMETLITGLQVILCCVIINFCVGFSGNFAILFANIYLFSMTSTACGVLVGCAVNDAQVAIELLPAILMPQVLFCGFFAPPELMPNFLAWIPYVFPLTYALRIGLINEFGNGRCDDLLMPFCDLVLTNTQSEPDDVWWYWLVSAALFLITRLLALMVLRRKATKFG